MMERIVFETTYLRIRPLQRSDISAIQQAAGKHEVSDTMISLPHPYPPGEAERYYNRQELEREAGRSFAFIIEKKAGEGFCGLIELRAIELDHSQGELSFWLAVEAWGRGYMTQVVQSLLPYGFEDLGLNRLYAYHMVRNPATGRVLEKCGFQKEGLLRQRVRKWGKYEDVVLCAILREDWRQMPEDRKLQPT